MCPCEEHRHILFDLHSVGNNETLINLLYQIIRRDFFLFIVISI